MSVLSFVDAAKRYDALDALRPVTLNIEAGSWCVITGPNGSGKTTLLQLASGLVDPTSGTVTVDGAKAGSTSARTLISYLSDAPAFFSDLSVTEHIEYLAGLFSDPGIVKRSTSMLHQFGLGQRLDDHPRAFSRGMKQKAAIALALARPAAVLMLDEPTRGLDEAGAETLVHLLREHQAEGKTIVTVTHESERFGHPAARNIAVADGIVTLD